jgi:hypothetical protein
MTSSAEALGVRSGREPSMAAREQTSMSPHSSRPSVAHAPSMHAGWMTGGRYAAPVMEMVEMVEMVEVVEMVEMVEMVEAVAVMEVIEEHHRGA